MSSQGIKSGQGYVSLTTDDSALVKGLDAAKAKFQQWGQAISMMGASLAALGSTITAPFIIGMQAFSAWGSEMTATMRQTGMGMLEMDELMDGFGSTMDNTTTSAESFVAAVAKMSEFILSARNGSADANAALREMGLSLSELQRMSNADRMMAFADGLNRIGDAGQRIARQRDVFGRGGLGINVQGGAAGVRARAARIDEVEGQLSTEDQRLAREYTQAMNEMKLAISGVWKTLGAAAAGSARDWLQILTAGIIEVRKFIENNREMIGTVFSVGIAVTAAGTALMILGGTIYAVGIALGWLSAAFAAAGGVFGLFKAAILVGVPGMVRVFLGFKAVVWLWAISMVVASALAGNAMMAFGLMAKAAAFLHAAGTMAMIAGITVYNFMTYAAAAATGVYTAGLIVAWVWENLVTGGAWLLVTALGALVIAVIAAGAVLGGALLLAPIVLMGMIIHQAAQMAGSYDRAGASISNSASNMRDALSDAASSTADNFMSAFSTIAEAGSTAFSTIRSAATRGDWQAVWETVKVMAAIAWQEIKTFGLLTFNDWVFAGKTIWNQITDSLKDAFAEAWVAIKIGFIATWNEIKAVAFEATAAIMRAAAMALPQGAARSRLEADAASLEDNAQNLRSTVDQRETDIRAERARQIAINERERAWRDAMLRDARDIQGDELREGNQGEIDRLRGALGQLSEAAWIADYREEDYGNFGNLGGALDGRKTAIAGSFSAATLFGALDGTIGGQEPPLERIRRLNEEAAAARRAQLRELQEIHNGVAELVNEIDQLMPRVQ